MDLTGPAVHPPIRPPTHPPICFLLLTELHFATSLSNLCLAVSGPTCSRLTVSSVFSVVWFFSVYISTNFLGSLRTCEASQPCCDLLGLLQPFYNPHIYLLCDVGTTEYLLTWKPKCLPRSGYQRKQDSLANRCWNMAKRVTNGEQCERL